MASSENLIGVMSVANTDIAIKISGAIISMANAMKIMAA